MVNIYAIRDNDIGAFNTPFFEKHDVTAVRAVKTGMNKSMLGEYPASFALYKIAEYDESTGNITPTRTPQLITELENLSSKENEDDKK